VLDRFARAYVAWLARHVRRVLVAVTLLVAGAVVLIATRLPIRADFSYLLPDDAPAIRDLRRLEQRMPAQDTTLILVVAHDPPARAAATQQLLAGLRTIDAALVARIEADDTAVREVIRAHRWLYASLDELVAIRDALARGMPLEPLRAAVRAKVQALDRSRFTSADGRTQLVIVRMAFRATDVPRDHALLAGIDRAIAGVHVAGVPKSYKSRDPPRIN